MSDRTEHVELAAQIVAAFVANNPLPAADIPRVIQSVHGALLSLQHGPVPAEPLTPPVPIRKSITPDYLVSLEDGQHYRTLKRHLAIRGLTPHEYRLKWGLPPDYPMVAPNYSVARSELAKQLGLGKQPARKARSAADKRRR